MDPPDEDPSGVRAFPAPKGTKPPAARALTPAQTQANENELLFTQMRDLTRRVALLEQSTHSRVEMAVREACSEIEEVLHKRQDRLRDSVRKWIRSVNEALAHARGIAAPEPPGLTPLKSSTTSDLPPREPDPRKR